MIRSSIGSSFCAVTALSIVIGACSSASEDVGTADAEVAACAAGVTTNKYDGPNYWGTITFKNGPTSVQGVSGAFDVPAGAHCTADTVPSGATLSPLSGSATSSNHCVFTFASAALAANATKSFNYSTDTNHSFTASGLTVSFMSCSQHDAGAPQNDSRAPRPRAAGGHDSSMPPPPPAEGGAHDSGANTDTGAPTGCDTPNLVWHSANKTNFTSYPDPGSDECIKYNGCMYEGQFAACPNKVESKSWVSSHNIVSVFPNLNKSSNGIGALALHDLCLKSGNKTIVVTVLDECADSDCSGCCTQNKGSKEELIDIESFTDARWGVQDGAIQWADLGPTKTMGCN
jgi:hypothetical protein